MSGHRSFAELTSKFSPTRKARVAELRQARERSQKDLVRLLKVNQPAVAKLEKRAGMYVNNLRRYVEALAADSR